MFLLTGALGLVVPLKRGAGGGSGSLPRALAQGSTHQGECEDILFVISFYLWCLFQLHCRFLMDSHFPCCFPSIPTPSLTPAGTG